MVPQLSPHRLIVRYIEYEHYSNCNEKYVSFVDNDDDGIFTQQKFAPRVPYVLNEWHNKLRIVGTSHGLLCLYGCYSRTENDMVILWNPSIRKSIGIILRGLLGWHDNRGMVFGFGVCPLTREPIIVKSLNLDGWQVEIFTLNSGILKMVPSRKFPFHESVRLTWHQVVINRCIYFHANKKIVAMKGDKSNNYLHMVVSFDMITKEFTILDLPDNLAYNPVLCWTMSKIRESLVVLEYNWDINERYCVVWMMMEQGVKKSFTKLFTIHTPGMRIALVLEFYKNGDLIIVTKEDYYSSEPAELKVYERCSQHVKHLGIYGVQGSFFMGSYIDTLLLLDQPNRFIY